MKAEEIIIRVDQDAAQAYQAASEDQRAKIDAILNLRLREVTQPGRSLAQLMDEIAQRAADRGLNPDILESLLNDR